MSSCQSNFQASFHLILCCLCASVRSSNFEYMQIELNARKIFPFLLYLHLFLSFFRCECLCARATMPNNVKLRPGTCCNKHAGRRELVNVCINWRSTSASTHTNKHRKWDDQKHHRLRMFFTIFRASLVCCCVLFFSSPVVCAFCSVCLFQQHLRSRLVLCERARPYSRPKTTIQSLQLSFYWLFTADSVSLCDTKSYFFFPLFSFCRRHRQKLFFNINSWLIKDIASNKMFHLTWTVRQVKVRLFFLLWKNIH